MSLHTIHIDVAVDEEVDVDATRSRVNERVSAGHQIPGVCADDVERFIVIVKSSTDDESESTGTNTPTFSEISLGSFIAENGMEDSVSIEVDAHDTEKLYGCAKRTNGQNSGRQGKRPVNLLSQVKNSLVALRQILNAWLRSSWSTEERKHHTFFLILMIACLSVTFFSMYGEFRYYLLVRGCTKAVSSSSVDFGPRTMLQWILKKGEWNIENALPWSFTEDYLIIWGGRHLPSMLHGRQWYRWFSCIFVHRDSCHFFSNVFMLFLFGQPLERKHGSVKVLFIFCFSHLCGALTSATFENPTFIVLGASGGIYGLLGLFMSDWRFCFSITEKPSLRLVCMLFGSVCMIASLFQMHSGVSHMSHIGGMVSGYCCALLLCRSATTYREWTIRIIGGLALASFVFFAFYYIYFTIMPSIPSLENVLNACS